MQLHVPVTQKHGNKMSNKPFSETLYKDNDGAKLLVIKWLQGKGYNAKVNPDDYGIDLLAEHKYSERKIEVEVEVKHNWVGQRFPFPNVHIPFRKVKFAKKNSVFAMLNSDRTAVLVVRGSVVFSSPVVSKKTKYTETERFFEIDLSECHIYPIDKSLKEYND
jgi:hypothetical protein